MRARRKNIRYRKPHHLRSDFFTKGKGSDEKQTKHMKTGDQKSFWKDGKKAGPERKSKRQWPASSQVRANQINRKTARRRN
jgi:hypothetical protein